MKTILLAAAALMALSATAQSRPGVDSFEMPKAYQGVWCQNSYNDRTDLATFSRKEKASAADCKDLTLTITAGEFKFSSAAGAGGPLTCDVRGWDSRNGVLP